AHLIVASSGEMVLNQADAQAYQRLISQFQAPSNYANGGMVGGGTPTLASALAGNSSGNVNVSVGDISVPGGDASGIDAPRLKQVLQAQIYSTLRKEQKPGGSLSPNRAGPYDR
ncbi:hypothetical protein, partial [Nostoc sp.]